jgi:hypothetical protein
MTETQAKSGAAGASTDAEDTSVETSATPDDGGNQSNVAAIADALESPTTVVRLKSSDDTNADSDDSKSSGFTWPAASAASTAAPTSPGSSTGGSAKSSASYTPKPVASSTPPVTPTPVASTATPTPVTKAEETKAEPTVKTDAPSWESASPEKSDDKVRGAVVSPTSSLTVPVIGVPASGGSGDGSEAGSGPGGAGGSGSTGPTAGSASSRSGSTGLAGAPRTAPGRPVTGTSPVKGAATVPGSAGLAPVIARAAVGAPPTQSGLRGTTGTQPVVTPGRPGSSAVGAARVTEAVRSARATVAGAATRGPRRARLHLKRIDPWSVMKFAFAVSLVLFVVAIVATSVLYLALDAMGVFDSINKALSDVVTGQSASDSGGFKITAKGVIGTSVLLGAVNMVLFTALMTLGAFVYNVCADLVGGVELTLSEKD